MCDHKILQNPKLDTEPYKVLKKLVENGCKKCIDKCVNNHDYVSCVYTLLILKGEHIDDFHKKKHYDFYMVIYYFTGSSSFHKMSADSIMDKLRDTEMTKDIFDLMLCFFDHLTKKQFDGQEMRERLKEEDIRVFDDDDSYYYDKYPINKELLDFFRNFLVNSCDQSDRWIELYYLYADINASEPHEDTNSSELYENTDSSELYEDIDPSELLDDCFQNVYNFEVVKDMLHDMHKVDEKHIYNVIINYIDNRYGNINIMRDMCKVCSKSHIIVIPYDLYPELCKKQNCIQTMADKKYDFYNDIIDMVAEYSNDDIECIKRLVREGYHYDINTFIKAKKSGNKKCATFLESLLDI